MFRFYRATVDDHSWGRQYLNRASSSCCASASASGSASCVARRGGELVAGHRQRRRRATRSTAATGARSQPLRHLHFNVCYYAAIEHCIAQRARALRARRRRRVQAAARLRRDADLELPLPRRPPPARRGRALPRAERGEAGRTIEWFAEHTAHRRDDGARLEALRRRLSPPRAATPGARTRGRARWRSCSGRHGSGRGRRRAAPRSGRAGRRRRRSRRRPPCLRRYTRSIASKPT